MDHEQRIAELERRISDYERARASRPTVRIGGRRLRRGLVIAALAMAVVVLPGVALASHIFTDVPNSHTFHDEIGNLFDARITTGCTPTTYCPENTVTRGQMAGFLNRGLGRAGSSDFFDTVPIALENLKRVTYGESRHRDRRDRPGQGRRRHLRVPVQLHGLPMSSGLLCPVVGWR